MLAEAEAAASTKWVGENSKDQRMKLNKNIPSHVVSLLVIFLALSVLLCTLCLLQSEEILWKRREGVYP